MSTEKGFRSGRLMNPVKVPFDKLEHIENRRLTTWAFINLTGFEKWAFRGLMMKTTII